MTSYNVAAIRAHFPALAEGWAHFDGPGGSQTPDVVADAMSETLRSAISNRGMLIAKSEQRAQAVVDAARQAVADLLNAPSPLGVIFGRSMTQITYDLARTLAKQWSPGDEIIVTSLDHDANIRPWVQAAERVDVKVRWAEFDPETCELPVTAVTDLLSPRTRLVAVTAASNLIGTRPDVPAITAAAHAAGALTYVDGVHIVPHAFVDMKALGADFFACSPYKFLGPHCGVVAADPALLETLNPDKLICMSDAIPNRFELGTLPFELLAGTTAAIDFMAGMVDGPGSRRERLSRSLWAMELYELSVMERLEHGLESIPGVVLHGCPDRRRTPTILFSVEGKTPRTVHEILAKAEVNAPAGSFYSPECARRIGLEGIGGIRAGIAPYTDDSDVDRILSALA